MKVIESYRVLVMPKHLNAANRLFGGQMMAWIDEAAALFVICQTGSQHIVTAKVSEVVFNHPVSQGDFLSFHTVVSKVGRTSLTIWVTVHKNEFAEDLEGNKIKTTAKVCQCQMVFVTIDPVTGQPKPHGIKHD